jgi:hypothetical protein
MIQSLKIIICPCNELNQGPGALFISLNKNKLINKSLWHQEKKELALHFQQHTTPNCNL